MGKKKVEVFTKEELEMMHVDRRVPLRKISIYKIVFTCLQKAYDNGRINQLTFNEVNVEVRKRYPNSRFNPYHLAHYKHKFLVEAPV